MPNDNPNALPMPAPSGSRPELIVVAKPDAGLRARRAGIASVAGADASSLESILNAHGAALQPLFGLSEDRLRAQQEAMRPTSTEPGATIDLEPQPDLSLFYRVAADESHLQELAEQLRSHDLVDAAYVKPPGQPPTVVEGGVGAGINDMAPDAGDAPPTTGNFVANQIYLGQAPAGVDALFANTLPGGDGTGVNVIDCEWAWRFTHEDLLTNQGGVVAGTSSGNTDHGTAVIGVISGDANSFGITGIAPGAVISASSFSDQSTSQAIKVATDKLHAGDIILLEIHRPGPNTPSPEQGQLGYIAIEWWPDDFAAIRYAVQKGIIVVEAAGNGFQNLDDAVYETPPTGFPASWKNPFNIQNASSGAVLVGAGAPPPNTHGHDWGPDRSRLDFSNYGARVDVQGWGREVTSAGYGDLQGGASQDLWYTNQFAGTSSASPIVVGTLACIVGVLRARGRRNPSADDARRWVQASGSPQQDATGRPASQRIGNRPNLRQLIPAAAGFQSRSADYDGDGRAEVLITSPWGVGILEQAGDTMAAPTMQPNGTRFGGWLLNTADNHFGPPGDYDGDGRAEVLVASPWGVGILEQAGDTMAAPMMAPNGTRFGGWLLNTTDNHFGQPGDFNGDGKAEVLVVSPWGIGMFELAGNTFTVPMMQPNGTRFGGWLLNTADNVFGPVGDFDGDGHAEIVVSSPWGIGILKLAGNTLTPLMMAPNGTRFGGWLLNTADNVFGPVGDFDGDGHAEIVVSSPWGIGILKLAGDTFTVPMMQPNGTRFGGWLLNTGDNRVGTGADYDGDGRAELLVTSPWGVGILEQAGNTMAAPTMQPNGTRFGGWLLNTIDNDFGHGT